MKTLPLSVLSLAGALLIAGCDSSNPASSSATASAAASTAKSATTSSASVSTARAPSASASASTEPELTIASIPLSTFNLDDNEKLHKVLAPEGWRPIEALGCSQAKVVGRSVDCPYGDRPVRVKFFDKEKPVKQDTGYKTKEYTYPNSVLISDGTKHLMITAGSEGKLEDAEAVAKALYDEKAKTFGGTKIADIKSLKELDPILQTKGYTGAVWADAIGFALRRASVITHYKDDAKPEGTFAKGADGFVEVIIDQREGEAPKQDAERILAAVVKR
ncbi:MAG: hypothetical protein HOW73_39445 [Polyangiaceae bacterium]|nr:hypothetical protein [Polyangiaceae bacterium]